MVKLREEQIGGITVLDEDSSGTVNASNANVQNISGSTHSPLGSTPSNNSFWVSTGSPTLPKFTDSSGNTITLGEAGSGGMETLAETLVYGNITSGNDIVISSGDILTSALSSTLTIKSQNNVGGTSDPVTIESGTGNITGLINLRTSNAASGSSGAININTGTSSGDVSGNVAISTGGGGTLSGSISLTTGNPSNNNSGNFSISTGTAGTDSSSGEINISVGDADGTGNGGNLILGAGDADTTGIGGAINISAGSGGSSNGNAGNINITSGSSSGIGDGGSVIITASSSSGGDDGNIQLSTSSAPITLSGGDGTIEIGTAFTTTRGIRLDSNNGVFIVGDGTNASISSSNIALGATDSESVTIKSGNQSGTGDTGDLILKTGMSASGNAGNVEITAGSGGLTNGVINLNNNTNIFGDGYVSQDFEIAGKLTVYGLIDPTGLVLDEQSSKPTNGTVTKGLIWLRDDGYLIFTDQSDVDKIISTSGNIILDHGSLTGLGDDDHTQYLLVDGTRAMSGVLDMGTNNINNVGTVDGVNISNHSARHENGGADEINVAGLSGLLADAQTPLSHASSHITGGGDEIDGDQLDIDFTPSNYIPSISPAEVTNVNHLSAHLAGIDSVIGNQSDHGSLLGLADDDHTQYLLIDGTRAMSADLNMGGSSIGNVLLVDGVDISSHASRHVTGGADEIDGDRLDIDWTPANYTPTIAPAEANNLNNLTAHLAGIDTTLGTQADHGNLTGLGDDDHAQYLLASGARSMTGDLNMSTNDITNVGLVDGIDISSHALRHITGGDDEIDGDRLDIDWAPTNYTPTTAPSEVTNLDHLTAHLAGIDTTLGTQSDHGNLAGLGDDDHSQYLLVSGTRAMSGALNMGTNNITNVGTVDGVDISNHSARHENGGADEINVAGLSGLLADAQTPLSHASSHITGGGDEIDGDHLDIDWNPSNYTPTTSPTEATSINHLTAHLAGIDNAIDIFTLNSSAITSNTTISNTTESKHRIFAVDTTVSTVTITLPAIPVDKERITIKDYGRSAGNNNITIARNGINIDGAASDDAIATNRASNSYIYNSSLSSWIAY